MNRIIKHINNIGIDTEMLDGLIDLYATSMKIDPNREKTGVDIFRNFEYLYPLEWLKDILKKSSKVLDIGSSSTIWPALIHSYFGSEIHATDIDMDHLQTQKHYLNNLDSLNILDKSFFLEYQDATDMTYQDNSFDV